MEPKKKNTGKILMKLVVIAIIVVAVTLVIMVWPTNHAKKQIIESPPMPVEAMEIIPPKELPDVVLLPGLVEPNKVVNVASEVAGNVDAIAGKDDKLGKDMTIIRGPASAGVIDKGDIVKKGQPIIYINTDILRANCEKARAELEFQTQEYGRVEQLFKKDVATRMEIDSVKMQRDMAQANYDLCKANLDRAIITAPIDGQVNELDVDPGEYVNIGMRVAQFVDMNTVKIVVDVSERDINYLKVGQSQKIEIGNFERRTLDGKITFISDLADPLTHTTRIEITVDNKHHLLRSGQFVKVYLIRQMLKSPVMVPLSAIIPLENGHVAYVYEDGKAKRRKVVLDYEILQGQNIRISSGLKAGDLVIIGGNRLVGPDQDVRLESTGKAKLFDSNGKAEK